MNIKKAIYALSVFLCALCLTGCFGGGKVSNVNKSEKISAYFTLGEALHSDYADKHKIKNRPNRVQMKNIRYTAGRMDKVRKILGRPITISSWFRSPKINRAVGGSSTSAHKDGLAVDFYLKKGSAKKEFKKLQKSGMDFDQLIFYPRGNRAHIGFRKGGKDERRQVMTYSRKR